MKPYLFLLAIVCVSLAVCRPSRADTNDLPAAELEKMKDQYKKTAATARADLLQAFDTKVKEVAQSGNLTVVKQLRAEKEAFQKDARLPTALVMKPAVAEYQQRLKRDRDALSAAYDKAVRHYTKALDLARADAINKEWETFKRYNFPAAAADAHPSPSSSTSGLRILAAFYGQNVSWIDVTDKLTLATKGKTSWSAKVQTADLGDPVPGWTGTRTLIVRYTLDGKTGFKAVYEGRDITLP
jgi:hypothetical protein